MSYIAYLKLAAQAGCGVVLQEVVTGVKLAVGADCSNKKVLEAVERLESRLESNGLIKPLSTPVSVTVATGSGSGSGSGSGIASAASRFFKKFFEGSDKAV